MNKPLAAFSTALAGAVLASWSLAAEPPGPGPHGPDMMFKRLDKNQDGKITAEEIPDQAPEFVKGLLKKADKNQDKTVTADEIRAAMRDFRPGFGPHAGAGSRFGRGPHPGPGPGPQTAGGGPGPGHGPASHGPSHGRGPTDQRGATSFRPPFPEPKAVFARLDRDRDGKLSPEEFAEGMKAFHQHAGSLPRPTAAWSRGMMFRGRAPWTGRAYSAGWARSRWAGRAMAQSHAPWARARTAGPPPWAAHARGHTRRPTGPAAMHHQPPRRPEAGKRSPQLRRHAGPDKRPGPSKAKDAKGAVKKEAEKKKAHDKKPTEKKP